MKVDRKEVVGEYLEHDDMTEEVLTLKLYPCDVCAKFSPFKKHECGNGCILDVKTEYCEHFEYSDVWDSEGEEPAYMPTDIERAEYEK